jgi:hypothetical protein
MDRDQTVRVRRLVWIHAGRKPIMLVLSWCRSFIDCIYLIFQKYCEMSLLLEKEKLKTVSLSSTGLHLIKIYVRTINILKKFITIDYISHNVHLHLCKI